MSLYPSLTDKDYVYTLSNYFVTTFKLYLPIHHGSIIMSSAYYVIYNVHCRASSYLQFIVIYCSMPNTTLQYYKSKVMPCIRAISNLTGYSVHIFPISLQHSR